MSHVIVNEIAILSFAALLVAAAVEDVHRLIIPNRIPLGIIILYPAFVLTTATPIDWMGASLLAACALGVGLVLFAFKFTGGGDVKLFVATSLWAGPAMFPAFVLVTSLVGAAIAVGMLVHRRFYGASRGQLASASGPDVAQREVPAAQRRRRPTRDLPYGVAIAAGGVQIIVHLLAGA